MRQFFRHFDGRPGRHVQFSVIDDGERAVATVARWYADEDRVRLLVDIPYEGIGRERARLAALEVAKQLAANKDQADDPGLPDLLAAQELQKSREIAQRETGLSVGGAAFAPQTRRRRDVV